MAVEILLLGEVAARVDERVVDLGPSRQRCVFVALAVDAGQVVPADRLVGRVWGADTPRRGRTALQSHISRLRGVFAGAAAIVHRSDGYLLEVEQAERVVDLLLFRSLRDQARTAGQDSRKVVLLTEALGLWSGDPLTGLGGEWVESERDRWQQERWAAEQDLVDAALRLGQGEELVARLSARTSQHRLDERVAGQYMVALHRAGRTADALDHFQRLRERLAEELGTDPGVALQDLHRQILAADPRLIPTPADTVTASADAMVEPVVTPRQLPAPPTRFVGRHDELDHLDAALATIPPPPASVALSSSGTPAPPTATSEEVPGGRITVISAIGGAGGIGKTWLALTWAHRNLDRFPDGQLFADLHGFTPTGQPAHPADVLSGFLDALGVDRDRQPTDLDRRSELYRSLVADKRMLIVLDNAVATDQITPLLPGSGHCTVVVTSRNHLRGLVARHGARPIRLDVLTDTEAHTLLTTALGADRTAADAPAVAELIALCGGFPLALGLIAARITANPHLPLADIITELRTLGLDALDADDPSASLPTVLSWSLHHLTTQQRQLFALLGIAPGPDTGLPAATHLLDLPERDTHAALRALTDASLIHRLPGNRYAMHDLVRAYATTTADNLPATVPQTALRRILDFYTHTARTADRLLHPQRDPVPFDPPTPDVHPHPLPDVSAALAWFDTEHACLLAAHHTATTLDWHATVWHLAWNLHTFHYWRGHRHNRLAVWQAAADAATHLPDPTTHTLAHQHLGLAHAELGHHEHALDHLHQALALAEHHHSLLEQAHIHIALGLALGQQGDDRTALDHARAALDLYRNLDNPVGEARALSALGWYAARLGDHDTARDHCQSALTLHRHHHNLIGEAATLDSLGYIDHHTGHHTQAITHYRNALTLLRDLGNTYEVADTLDDLGHPHAALGHTETARTVWREAVQLYREQGRHNDAARVQHQLDNLDHPPKDNSVGT
ncbi:BTAD domain-containing putative transcriptional regulator [Saccharothrix sp.]|uniref:AfsR/SARP family transcriptional regulator n=1 Tax=Saccharothrix sp. TaxID=1873460 RepID=UPI002811231E|nr:BTAD domain-containing putative transcriptional regulator [Saccharothrix sp.]